MDAEELRLLLSKDGLALLERAEAGLDGDVVREVTRLRAEGHDPRLVAAVLTQARLRRRARAKFGEFASGMLFTEAGLEQATRLRVAAHHAGRMRRAGIVSVADLGCGIGADALAFATLGLEVTAVERDEVTAAIATYNLAAWHASVVHGDALDTPVDAEALWFDPARRDGARRLSDPADWSPPLDAVFARAAAQPAGVKLAPGIDRDLLPPDAEHQWVTDGLDTVEAVVWTGRLARPGVARSALVLGDGVAEELAGDPSHPEPGELDAWLYEPAGAVIRAELIGALAERLDARAVSDGIAYLTAARHVGTPLAQAFRVRETLPLDERRIAQRLRELGIGELEIKKRGADIDPAALRRRLKLRGDARATLILTRIAGRHRAVLADRA
ncbi:class I SAM-dependent methyltransferase [Agrococcus sediminis]|uniref:Class I SAM-dependent methyltransferase n=1 Tax=Agrococcus sediminis TaxID=2599924 RepID=A0A5M8QIT4_9MICO|nr:class I SAM-dependent methyltransferase [Agrococcus sediminis]KAA6435041.1 class I SAM-dependent methyltransferase [Agrococcus sediminis]